MRTTYTAVVLLLLNVSVRETTESDGQNPNTFWLFSFPTFFVRSFVKATSHLLSACFRPSKAHSKHAFEGEREREKERKRRNKESRYLVLRIYGVIRYTINGPKYMFRFDGNCGAAVLVETEHKVVSVLPPLSLSLRVVSLRFTTDVCCCGNLCMFRTYE